jgi:hypothetical protein
LSDFNFCNTVEHEKAVQQLHEQFIAKVKGKKGERWEVIWRKKGQRIEGWVRGVKFEREEERKRKGGRQRRDRREVGER